MKIFYTIIFSMLCFAATATPTFEKLASINSYWLKQTDIPNGVFTEEKQYTDKELIRHHLTLVEQTLRARSTKGLNATQIANRNQALQYLHEYWIAGNFPINDIYSYRTPIFIDKHENFCAVGYLIKASGNEAISRKIAANTNSAYVRDMHYPELGDWAGKYGFTVDELAWIQPTYGPTGIMASIGKGTDGEVNELFVNAAKDKLYVGGKFTNVDSTMAANNIAYVTEANGVYTWHTMRGGVNGRVNAIVEFDNKIFVAGSFSMADTVYANNVAYWDGTSWHSLGCTYGEIKDLLVYNGELYACGRFDVCAALSEVNFAKWNGSVWQQKFGLSGTVNTMTVYKGDIVLGGSFVYQNDTVNAIKWNDQTMFQKFTNKVNNEVKDFAVYKDSMYVACKLTSTDSQLVKVLRGSAWGEIGMESYTYAYNGTPSFNTLCVATTAMMLGGNFNRQFMIGTASINCTAFGFGYNWFVTDSAINKIVVFKNHFVAGGKFKYDGFFSGNRLNSIAYEANIFAPTAVPETKAAMHSFKLYPNPVLASAVMVENDFNATSFALYDMSGKLLLSNVLKSGKEMIVLPELATGVYFVEVKNDAGVKLVQKLVVQ